MHHRTDLLHGLGHPGTDRRSGPGASGYSQVVLKAAALLGVAAFLWSCSPKPPPASLSQRVGVGLQRAADYLEKAQAPDGSWKSGVYRDMGSGMELTPFAAKALSFSGKSSDQRALQFLLGARREELIYPVYTGAGTLLLLSRSPDDKSRQEWLRFLSSYQLTEELGWKPSDPDYGGWGYAMKPPRKGGGDPMASANLSSTTFALGALTLSGGEKARVTKALSFVRRCQNADGGFRANLSDLTMNKAGPENSYGSASSDGLRALLRAGLPADDPAVAKAWAWVEKNFQVEVQPGAFPEARFADRDGLLIYYLWSTSHALAARERAGLKPDERTREMARQMCERILQLQMEDGSWRNSSSASREDDPLVATPMAMAVLALGRQYLP